MPGRGRGRKRTRTDSTTTPTESPPKRHVCVTNPALKHSPRKPASHGTGMQLCLDFSDQPKIGLAFSAKNNPCQKKVHCRIEIKMKTSNHSWLKTKPRMKISSSPVSSSNTMSTFSVQSSVIMLTFNV